MMERAMEQLNVQLSRLTRSLRRARTVELPEGNAAAGQTVPVSFSQLYLPESLNITFNPLPFYFPELLFH